MRSISLWLWSTIVATSVVPRLASSQESQTIPISRTPLISSLRVGDITRISSGGRTAQGRIAKVGRDSMWLASGVVVPVLASDTVWSLRRQTGKGAAIGAAVVGVGFGALVGAMSSGLCDAADCSGAFSSGFIAGGIIGAGGGAILGAAAGSLVRRWRRVMP